NAASSEEIAATSEELTGQAGMLQRTIAFFKVDAGAPGRVQTAAESNAAMADIKALRDVETEKGNDDGRTSDEYVTYMDQSKSDKLDAEFERF
ncbi:MAG: hypothetical protein GY801_38505, partial [bacterium]|nr:hypothetical protein [bacterium]